MTVSGRIASVLIATLMVAGLSYLLWVNPIPVGSMLAVVAVFISAVTIVLNQAHRLQLTGLAAARQGEAVCSFARSFERRAVDSWIIRAVHEELQDQLSSLHARFPLRQSDRLVEDLKIDPEDLTFDVVDIARRVGRDLQDTKDNPYYDKVDTVGDLVRFLSAQPRLQAGKSAVS